MVVYGHNCNSGFGVNAIEQPLFNGVSRRQSVRPDERKRQIVVDGKFFDSVRAAATTCGISESTLGCAVRNRASKCKGHVLIYT